MNGASKGDQSLRYIVIDASNVAMTYIIFI